MITPLRLRQCLFPIFHLKQRKNAGLTKLRILAVFLVLLLCGMFFTVVTSGKSPKIQIYNPQNEQLVSDTVEIVAEVESKHPLCYAKVSFDEGDSWNVMSRKDGDDYFGKYTFDWNTEKDSNGKQRILVKALDTFGRSDSCAVIVNVFNGENSFILSSYSLQVQPSPIDSSETNQITGLSEESPFLMYWITPGNNSFHNEFVEIEVLVAEQDSYIDEIWYRVINETASAKGDIVVDNTSLPISQSVTQLNVSSWNDDTIYRIEAFSSNIFGVKASLSGKYSMYFIKGNTSIIDRTPPEVEILDPEDGEVVDGVVTIDGYAFDDNLDTVWIEIRNSSDYSIVNQTLASPNFDYEWNTTSLPHGFYFVTLYAIDTTGNLASYSITLIDPLTATLTSPEDGSYVSGDSVLISFTATEETEAWVTVESIDGLTIYWEWPIPHDTSSAHSYSYTWDSTTVPADGDYNIVAHVSNGTDTFNDTHTVTVDNTPPEISNVQVSPSTGQSGTVFTITAEVSDTLTGVSSVTAYIQFPDETDVATVTLYDDGAHSDGDADDGTYGNTWDSTGQAPGVHYVDIVTVDTLGNSGETENGDIFIIDDTPPAVSIVQVSPAAGQPGTTFTITAEVSDTLSGVSSVTAYIQLPDETNVATVTLYDDGAHSDGVADDGTYGNTWNSAGQASGVYYVDIVAVDFASNSGETENVTTFKVDGTPPAVSNVQVTPATGQPGTTFTITAVVTDPLSSVNSVTAHIQFPDETDVATVTLYDDGLHSDGAAGDGTYGNTWDSTGQAPGVHYVDIVAVDTLGNSGETENGATFILDDTPPGVSNVQISPAAGQPGTTFTITAVVTDTLSGVSSVTAYIQFPDETNIATVTLYDDGAHSDGNAGDGTYGNTWDSSGQASGLYYVDIVAVDTAGNSGETENGDTFIIDGTPPGVSNVQVTPSTGQPGTIFTITAQVSDTLSTISSVTAYLQSPDEMDITTVTLYDDGLHSDGAAGDGTYGNTWDSSGQASGLYYVDIVAVDTAGNSGETENGDTFIIDGTPPGVSNVQVTPSTGQPGTIFTITAQVSDTLSGVSSVTAHIQFPDETNIATVTLYDDGLHSDGAAGDGTYGNTWDSSGQASGVYYVDIVAVDTLGNSGETENGDTFIIDGTPPGVSNVQVTPSTGQPGTIFTITAQVSDTLSGVSSVTAHIQFPDETDIATVTLYDDGLHSDGAAGDGTYGNTWDSTGRISGVHYVDIVAIDNATNQGENNNGDTFIIDNTPPGVSNVQVTPSTGQPGTIFTITAQVSDTLSGVSSVTAHIQFPDETDITTVTLYDDGLHSDGAAGDGTYGNTWDSTGQASGLYYVDIVAVDTLGNSGETENAATITIDDTPPAVSNVQVTPSAGQPGTIFTITAVVTDALSGMNSVTAHIQLPDETDITTVTLYDDGAHSDGAAGDGTYGNTWDSTGQLSGTYYVDIVATDNAGNSGETENGATFIISDTPPDVSNVQVTPSIGQSGTIFTITANVTSPSGISSVTAYIQFPDETDIAVLTLYDDGLHSDGSAGDGTYGNTWDSTGQASGLYYVDIVAIDNASNQGETENAATFTIDDTPPGVSNVQVSPSTGQPGTIFTITAVVTDPLSGVSSVTAYVQFPDETNIATLALYDDGLHSDGATGDGTYGNTWDSTGQASGVYYVDIVAVDSLGNSGETENGATFTVDGTPPAVSNVQVTPSTAKPGTTFTITAVVTDTLSSVNSVTAHIQFPDETDIATVTLYDDGAHSDGAAGDGTYGNTWDSTGQVSGVYYVDIVAVDSLGNSGETENGATFTVDGTPPAISNIQVTPSTAQPGTIFTITAQVSDTLSGVSSVTAYIQFPDETDIATVTLYDDGLHSDGAADDGTYGNTWDSTGRISGVHYVDIVAIDNATNQGEYNNGGLLIIDSTPPAVSNVQITPSTAQPGTTFTITAQVSDILSGVSSVTAYIQFPDETDIATVTLYDDGAHSDGAAGDGTYGNTWDSTGQVSGVYYVDIVAVDTLGNSGETENGGTFIIDGTPPAVSNVQVSPVAGQPGMSFTITAVVTDPLSGVNSVTAYIQFPDETDIATVTLYDDGLHSDGAAGDGTYGNTWDSTGQSVGTYYVDIVATDTLGNSGETENGTTFIISDTPPEVSNVQVTPAAGQPGTTFTISAEVTSPFGISSVTAYIQFPDETNIATVTLYDDGLHSDGAAGDGTYGNTWNSAAQVSGVYYVDIIAVDTLSNTGETENGATFIIDDTPPAVSNVQVTPSTAQPGTTFTITAQVSDTLSSISSVTAYIQFPDETNIATVTLYDDGLHSDGAAGDGTYGNIWNSAGQASGVYYVDIVAVDTTGNSGETENGTTFTIDGTPPAVSNVQVTPSTAQSGTTFTITAQVSDTLSGVSGVTAYIQFPDETNVATVNLYDDGGHSDGAAGDGTYGNTWNSAGQASGLYYVDIVAVDTAGNSGGIENGTTFIIDDIPPVVFNPQVSPTAGQSGISFTITAVVTDTLSGVSSVTAYIQLPDETTIATVNLYDDGAHSDGAADDGTYGNTWDSTGQSEGDYYVDIIAFDNATNQIESENGDTFIISNTAPTVTNVLIFPSAGQSGTLFTIRATVTSTVSIHNVTAYLQFPDETDIWALLLYDDGIHDDGVVGNGIYGNTVTPTVTTSGVRYIDIVAIDNAENEIEVENAVTFIIDDDPPEVTNAQVIPSAGQAGTLFTISVVVTDPFSAISSVTAYIQYPDETTIAAVTLYDDGAHSDGDADDGTYGNIWNSVGRASGIYYIDILTEDALGNSGQTENVQTVIIDDNRPTVSSVQVSPSGGQSGTIFTVTAFVTDPLSGVSNVTAYIQFPDETDIALLTLYDDGLHNDTNAGDGIYGNTWNSTGQPEGFYYVDIVAVDNVTNTRSTENSFLFEINNPPEVTNVQVTPSVGQSGTSFIITANVTDSQSIVSVIAHIQFPDETDIDTVTLYDDGLHSDGTAGDGTYGNTWDSTGQSEGAYYIDIVATDNAANTGETENGASFIIDDTPPVVSSVQVSPAIGQSGTSFTITADVSDTLTDVTTVLAYIQRPNENNIATVPLYDDGLHGDGTEGDDIFGNTWTSSGQPEATYYIDIEAFDNANNQKQVEDGVILFIDNTPPVVSDELVTPLLGQSGTPFEILANVTDALSAISNVMAYIQLPDETDLTTVTLYDDGAHNDGAFGDGIYGNTWDSTGQASGVYYVDIIAVDSVGNSGETENVVTFIVDDIPPYVSTDPVIPQGGRPGTNFTLIAFVNDTLSGVVISVTAYIQYPDETDRATVTLYDDGAHNDGAFGDGIYGNTWNSTGQVTAVYYVDIIAVDTLGNSGETENATKFIIDDISPEMPPNFEPQQSVENPDDQDTVTILIPDPIDDPVIDPPVLSVYLNYTVNGSPRPSRLMEYIPGSSYRANIPPQSEGTVVVYWFHIFDMAGNDLEITNSSYTYTVAGSGNGGGGGGGGGGDGSSDGGSGGGDGGDTAPSHRLYIFQSLISSSYRQGKQAIISVNVTDEAEKGVEEANVVLNIGNKTWITLEDLGEGLYQGELNIDEMDPATYLCILTAEKKDYVTATRSYVITIEPALPDTDLLIGMGGVIAILSYATAVRVRKRRKYKNSVRAREERDYWTAVQGFIKVGKITEAAEVCLIAEDMYIDLAKLVEEKIGLEKAMELWVSLGNKYRNVKSYVLAERSYRLCEAYATAGKMYFDYAVELVMKKKFKESLNNVRKAVTLFTKSKSREKQIDAERYLTAISSLLTAEESMEAGKYDDASMIFSTLAKEYKDILPIEYLRSRKSEAEFYERQTLCVKCGFAIPEEAQECPNCGQRRAKCIICGLDIQHGEEYIRCPYCKVYGHKDLYLGYLRANNRCPNCKIELNENNVIKDHLDYQILDYIGDEDKRRVKFSEIASEFEISTEEAESIIQILVEKNYVNGIFSKEKGEFVVVKIRTYSFED